METIILTLISVVLVSLISLLGVAVVTVAQKRMHVILLLLVAFSAGALFGDAFLHLLPEAAAAGFTVNVALYAMLGVVVSFVLEKMIHWSHCHVTPSKRHVKEHRIHRFAYMNLFGDGVHNFIDGLIIAASYLVSLPVGIATTIAVAFHEIPQEIGDFGVLLHGGFSVRRALGLNFLSAILAIVGATIGIIIGSATQELLIPLLAFAAGNFIYIAGADLIPELHIDCSRKETVMQLILFLAGIGVMLGMLSIEGILVF